MANRGGPRPGAGRKRIHPLKEGVDYNKAAAAQNAEIIAKAEPRRPGQKSAVTILREGANALYSLAALYQPKKGADGKMVGDEAKFRQYLSDAGALAGKLAPFEGPTFASIRMMQLPIDVSKLTDEELELYARLTDKAAADAGGDQGRAGAAIN